MIGRLARTQGRQLIKHFSNQYNEMKGMRNAALDRLSLEGVTIVKDRASAAKALKVLHSLQGRIHAWDTETLDLEVKLQSPVVAGKIICFQGFAGPDVDFGNGPRLFVDNFGERHELVQMFKEYFEDPNYLKTWFNYGFDRHIFYNHGIDVKYLSI